MCKILNRKWTDIDTKGMDFRGSTWRRALAFVAQVAPQTPGLMGSSFQPPKQLGLEVCITMYVQVSGRVIIVPNAWKPQIRVQQLLMAPKELEAPHFLRDMVSCNTGCL